MATKTIEPPKPSEAEPLASDVPAETPVTNATEAPEPPQPDAPLHVKVLNVGRRPVNFAIPQPHGAQHLIEILSPSQEREFTGDAAAVVKTVLAGAFKPLVDNGELVVDGEPKTPTTPAA